MLPLFSVARRFLPCFFCSLLWWGGRRPKTRESADSLQLHASDVDPVKVDWLVAFWTRLPGQHMKHASTGWGVCCCDVSRYQACHIGGQTLGTIGFKKCSPARWSSHSNRLIRIPAHYPDCLPSLWFPWLQVGSDRQGLAWYWTTVPLDPPPHKEMY